MTLEQDLQKKQVIHLDLRNFTAVKTGTSVRETVKRMQVKNRACAVVTDRGCLMGIFTGRDILRKIVDAPETWDKPIDEVMTLSPTTVRSKDRADKALALMDEKHFRNIPVLNDEGYVVGNLTHYAVIKFLSDRFPEEVYNLPPDSEQIVDRRSGA